MFRMQTADAMTTGEVNCYNFMSLPRFSEPGFISQEYSAMILSLRGCLVLPTHQSQQRIGLATERTTRAAVTSFPAGCTTV